MATAKNTHTSTTAAAPVRHRPAITRSANEFGATYRLVCTCGRTGEQHQVRSLARMDLDRHLTALPLVPEHQQCRDPQRHDCRPWEPCELCEGQEALFGLPGPATVRETR
ncbi:hypothetical protein [Microbispora triticiradicis]|uniref:hypothetical protein n=1 Tax=Microbispora triticiradicis TaxID=2200763 RepID=UPI001AD78EA5|nr:hypothetical protein [Microbispora triticiradicis]MBO4274945.1 hypothetical protein [Microbispora triticiradicis]